MRILLLAILLAGCENMPVGKPECVAAYRQASADGYKGGHYVEALMNAVGAGQKAFDRCESAK